MNRVLIYIPNKRFFASYGGVGGHITHFLGVVEGFKYHSKKVAVLTSEDIKQFDYPVLHNVDDACTFTFSNTKFFHGLRNLFRLIYCSNEYDLIYIRYSQSQILMTFLLSVILKKKLVLEVNSFGTQYRKWFYIFDAIFLSKVTNWVCISEDVAAYAQKFAGPKANVIIVPNGVSADRLASSAIPHSLNLCYIGVLKPGYVLEKFMESFLDTDFCHSGGKLHIFGGGSWQTKLFEEYNSNSIIFHGPQAWSHVRDFLSKEAPILVYPSAGSFSFQSPIKMYEYLASGLPIIAQITPNIQRLHIEFPYFQLGNLEEATEIDRLCDLLSADPPQTLAQSETAISSIRAKHLWKHRIERVLTCLKD